MQELNALHSRPSSGQPQVRETWASPSAERRCSSQPQHADLLRTSPAPPPPPFIPPLPNLSPAPLACNVSLSCSPQRTVGGQRKLGNWTRWPAGSGHKPTWLLYSFAPSLLPASASPLLLLLDSPLLPQRPIASPARKHGSRSSRHATIRVASANLAAPTACCHQCKHCKHSNHCNHSNHCYHSNHCKHTHAKTRARRHTHTLTQARTRTCTCARTHAHHDSIGVAECKEAHSLKE